MRAPTPLEVCVQIASEHAANTTAAIAEERAARLAAHLQDNAHALIELANENREPNVASEAEPNHPIDPCP